MEKKPFRREARRFCDLQKDNNNGLEGTGPPDHGTDRATNRIQLNNGIVDKMTLNIRSVKSPSPTKEQQQEQWSTSSLVDNLKRHLTCIELSKSKVQTDFLIHQMTSSIPIFV